MTTGDLGRRVRRRREQLGLTVDAVADRAGMHPSYVVYVETSPAPNPTRGALWRLATALDTDVGNLTGLGSPAPSGSSPPRPGARLDVLEPDECWSLLGSGGVGRVVVNEEERGPVAHPVNFRVDGGAVVFRTEYRPTFMAAVLTGPVSFEVDYVDDGLAEGWSVLLTGQATVVDSTVRPPDPEAPDVQPWAGGTRDLVVTIVPDQVTGRSIRHVTG
jgi:transcriptional regulator with XRE-family HTH domain